MAAPDGRLSIACAAVEAFTRTLAAEVGPAGVRVTCIRSNLIPESHPGIYDVPADSRLRTDPLLRRLPRLDEVSRTIVYAASDGAGAMTGNVVDLTCGAIVG